MASLLEDGLIKTASIEQVVAPITTHLCHLILLCESSQQPEHFAQLETAAKAVAKAAKHMATVASRLVADTEDEVMRMEMAPLVESLTVAGQHVLLASQKLNIQPDLDEHREELVVATQNVLLGVVKILLVEDDARVRRIVAASHWLLDCVSQIDNAVDMPSLLKAFRVFSRAVLLTNNLVQDRMHDLRSPRQREQVRSSLDTLTKCISMLHTATSTTIKHPASEQAQAAKTYVLQQVTCTVNDIISTLKSSCHWTPSGPNGYYTDRRNSLLRVLSVSDCSAISVSDFDVLLRDLVFHCMMVANTSRSEIQPGVAENCRHALRLWTDMSYQLKNQGGTLQSSNQHLESLCASLIRRIHKLDEAVVTATLCQVLDVFVSAGAPMEQLVSTVNHLFEGEPEGRELDRDSFQPLLRAFHSHADRMVQVAGFVAALATDTKSLERVENSRACLKRLRDAVAPVLQELRGDSVQCSGALQKLLDLHQRWADDTDQLLNAFSDIMDTKAFTSLAVQGMEDSLRGCDVAHKCQDLQLFGEHAGLLVGHMNQVIQAVRRHVDKSDDPIYRNGLLVLVRQAEAAAAEVTGCVTDVCSGSGHDDDAYVTFSDHLALAIKNFEVLREGLDGLKHPDLLSPLREEARNPMNLLPVLPSLELTPSVLDPKESEPEERFSDQDSRSIVSTVQPVPELEFVANPVDQNFSTARVQHFQRFRPSDTKIVKSSFVLETRPHSPPQKLPKEALDLLPLLSDVVSMTKGRDVTALNEACSGVLELSNCYTQAAKEATFIIDKDNSVEVDILRSELVSLTPLLVQTAQETAMSTAMTMESIYKHSTQFSDLIRNTRNILLPVAGTWYRVVFGMFQSHTPNAMENLTQELTDVMCLSADVVQLITYLENTARGEGHESISVLQSKLNKAQTNTKQVTDLTSKPALTVTDIEGPCLLWALSMQVLLNSLDKIVGTAASANTGQLTKHQMTLKKWLTTVSENSLRIQEAARLSSLICRDQYRVKTLGELQAEVKMLTDTYLQAEENLRTVCDSGILPFAKSELLQRQLQAKMKMLSGLLSKVNRDYVLPIENAISLAYSAAAKNQDDSKVLQAQEHFEKAAELLLENVKASTESVQDCFNYIRDPRERIQLRSINDHLSFQMSDIISRIRLMVETRACSESLSLEIQTQCWAAKAHYLVEQLFKADGVLERVKEQVKFGLQGKKPSEAPGTWTATPLVPVETVPPTNTVTDTKQSSEPRNARTVPPTINIPTSPKQEHRMQSGRGPLVSSYGQPCLTFTCLYLKRETEKWESRGNHIVQATKDIADRIYHMAQYLKRKGPIQSKEAFVSSAKHIVSSCQSITQFLRVIADHCLDKHCTDDLILLVEQILTITNQLTIISSVNALTPGSKSSDESLVKNAQNLLQIVLKGVRAAETACIKLSVPTGDSSLEIWQGLRQPEPNTDAARAAALCFQWKKNLLLHRAMEIASPDTDDLGLRRTSAQPAEPSLAPTLHMLEAQRK
ncbi:hypothetical protein ACEWY4_020768 [Coilia grayii]|uniref:Vinculin n=1 Tax=Coilia grayii TaxID=363190 RepID=A0ABD1J9J0_9TELE